MDGHQEIQQKRSVKQTTVKKEIEHIEDIRLLVNEFYKKVLKDETLSIYFAPSLQHWDAHLEIMYKFWDNILFFTGSYIGNPMEKHRVLNDIKPLEARHFDTWLIYFHSTVDELFTGEKAELAKQRAYSIAVVMKLKLLPNSQ